MSSECGMMNVRTVIHCAIFVTDSHVVTLVGLDSACREIRNKESPW